MYAKTKTRSFEEVTLKLLGLGATEAVVRYLSDKLDHMRSSDRAQLTMVCTWLTEMYLDKLNAATAAERPDHYQQVLDQLTCLLQDHVKNLDAPTTYQLMLQHGRMDVMLYYAQLKGDHHRVISHYMQQGEWALALEQLAKSNHANLYYQHAPTLMQHAPVATTNALINATRSTSLDLEPRKLMPALMRYDAAAKAASTGCAAQASTTPKHANQALRFLVHCVKNLKYKDPVMTKHLVSLLAKQQDEVAMVGFLNECAASGMHTSLDLHYAYRACQAANKKHACVMILSLMGQYGEAVDGALALADVDLAKINADKVDDDPEVRKRLWLKIAKFVVLQTGDVQAAMALICDTERSCPLKVEDVLPLFPDFAVIDHLKDAICASLEDYQRHIQGLKRGMQDASKTSELIRKDMNELRSRFGFVKGSDCCRLCSTPVLSSALYLFPCQHALHMSCVEHYMLRHGGLSSADKKRIKELKAALHAQDVQDAHGVAGPAPSTTVDYAREQAELDDLLASDCPICGIPAIRLLDQPLPSLPGGSSAWALPPVFQAP